jgi:hypothetical protein
MSIEIVILFKKIAQSVANIHFENSIRNLDCCGIMTLRYLIKSKDRDTIERVCYGLSNFTQLNFKY